MNITIRQKKLADVAETLFDLEKTILTCPYHLGAAKIEQIHQYYSRNKIIIPYENEKPVGYLAYNEDEEGIEIFGFGVLPEYQGKKIGAKLMLYLLKREKGKEMRLVTHPNNVQALTFYFKFGFRVYGWKDNYYGNGQPRLQLRRER